MILVLAITVGVLYAIGTYLLQQRTLTRVIIGLVILGHGANLLLLTAGGDAGSPPLIGNDGVPVDVADPLPQALALTAVVISFGVTAFLLALAYRSWQIRRTDEVENDVEDRRIAERARHQPLDPELRGVDADKAGELASEAPETSGPVEP